MTWDDLEGKIVWGVISGGIGLLLLGLGWGVVELLTKPGRAEVETIAVRVSPYTTDKEFVRGQLAVLDRSVASLTTQVESLRGELNRLQAQHDRLQYMLEQEKKRSFYDGPRGSKE